MPAGGRAIVVAAQALYATLDLHFVETILRPAARGELPRPEAGDAFVAGGTWLFSEPQPALRRLVDLHALAWPALVASPGGGLEIAATCRLAELERFAAPSGWPAAALFGPCVHARWGSFKIRNMATVGGNLCLALPAGPMAALATALDGECLVWTPDGGERRIAAADFVLGAGRNALRAGEVLRALHLPEAALRRRCAFRQASLTRFGRSAALVIGTLDAEGGPMRLTVTAATCAPIRIDFPAAPTAAGLAARLAQALPDTVLHADVHGAPDWKRHMAGLLCEEIRQELEV
jgi:CO/xanthine dehydrogenase FAD-binding subunit